MFKANGRCGYILKPSNLRSKSAIEKIKKIKEQLEDQSSKQKSSSQKSKGGSGKKLLKEVLYLKASSSSKAETKIEGGSALEEDTEEKEEQVLQEDDDDEERLKITVISGQTIQTPKSGQGDDDVVDPYVEVKLFGEPNQKQKFKTKFIKNNGKSIIIHSLSSSLMLSRKIRRKDDDKDKCEGGDCNSWSDLEFVD
jgi:hypothetical protein